MHCCKLSAALARSRIQTIVLHLIFQARPEDYARDFLAHQVPISFHKHWNIDPVAVFNKWLRDDSAAKASDGLDKSAKTEL